MSSQITVTFPGGKRVDASYNGFTIATDQAVDAGGDGSAPEPFDFFLSSIATCTGIYVLGFCQKRGIDNPHQYRSPARLSREVSQGPGPSRQSMFGKEDHRKPTRFRSQNNRNHSLTSILGLEIAATVRATRHSRFQDRELSYSSSALVEIGPR